MGADLAVCETEEAVVGEGDAVEVRSEVLENGKAVTGRAAIDHPVLFPEYGGSQGEEVSFFQGITELGPEDGRQSLRGQEEFLFTEAPASLGRDAAAGDEEVEMGVVTSSPGLQHGDHADLAADKTRSARQLV